MSRMTVWGGFRRSVLLVIASVLSVGVLGLGLTRSASADTRDCDDNAVMRCGAFDYNELVTKYRANEGNTQGIFAAFGINNEAALQGMVSGRVTSDNKVYVGDQLVATSAMTAGRQNMPGSTPIAGGAAYERPPSTSFNQPSLTAFVKMDGSTFRYAVIWACGNPVIATPVSQPQPQPTPGFQVIKDVRIKGQTAWQQDVMAKPGETIEYRITVKNTGETDLPHVMLRDVLPSGISAGSTTQYPGMFDQGNNLGTIAVGQSKEVIFEAKVADTADACDTARLRNIAFAKPDNQTEKNDDALVQVCKPQVAAPVCDALELTKLGGRKVGVNVKYTANTAEFKHVTFNYGDGTIEQVADTKTNAEHTYAQDGEYVVAATLTFTRDGKDITIADADCTAKVKVAEAVVTTITPGATITAPPSGVLPSTGAGNMIGIFLGVSTVAGFLHRKWSLRGL